MSKVDRTFPRLDAETRTHVDTETAAYHLNRKIQTLRIWSAYGTGPLKPVRAHGRLLWSVADIKTLTQTGAPIETTPVSIDPAQLIKQAKVLRRHLDDFLALLEAAP